MNIRSKLETLEHPDDFALKMKERRRVQEFVLKYNSFLSTRKVESYEGA